MASRSLVVYRGPSRYDPATIIRAVLVLKSANVKTGNMAQVFILHDTVPPHVAQRTGEDAAVCGACPLRPALNGGCYVTTFQGPLSTWKSTNGRDVASRAEILRALQGRKLRLGAYGDAAALPVEVSRYLVACVGPRSVTCYTHGHRFTGSLDFVSHMREFSMLSCETEEAAYIARVVNGWRTFRVRPANGATSRDEIECPSERGVNCIDCMLCSGAAISAKSITLPAHGFAEKKALRVVA